VATLGKLPQILIHCKTAEGISAKKTRPAANKSRPAKNVRLEEAIQQLLNNVTTGLNPSQEHFELSNVEFTLLLSGNSEWILDLPDGTSKAKGTAHKVKLAFQPKSQVVGLAQAIRRRTWFPEPAEPPAAADYTDTDYGWPIERKVG
jgi:hypothetical protein